MANGVGDYNVALGINLHLFNLKPSRLGGSNRSGDVGLAEARRAGHSVSLAVRRMCERMFSSMW